MKPIYQVTCKAICLLIEKEFKAKAAYIPKILRKLRKTYPYVLKITFIDSAWDNKVHPRALLLDPKFIEKEKDFNKKWKEFGRTEYKAKFVTSYWPKRNTNAGRDLDEAFTDLTPISKAFFQGDDIKKAVGYLPKKFVEDATPTELTINSLSFGYKKLRGKPTVYFFSGYKGYKPVKGVKELYISEYNALMGN